MKKGYSKIAVLAIVLGLAGGCSLWEPSLTKKMSVSDPVERTYAIPPKTIMVDGLNIKYMEAGEGPWVVMIHGGVIPMNSIKSFLVNPLTDASSVVIGYMPLAQSVLHAGALTVSDTWNYNIQTLASEFHVVALDLPGFGGSDKPDIDYSLDDFIIYLDAFMAAKGIDKAMLVGHGLGGEIAITYTLEHPEKVEKLVLVDSFGAYGLGARWPFWIRSPLNLPRFAMKYWQNEKRSKARFYLPLMRRISGSWEKPAKSAVTMTVSQQVKYDHENRARKLILSREGNSGKFVDYLAEYKAAYVTTEDFRNEVQTTHLALMETRRKHPGRRLGEIQAPVLIIRGQFDPIVKQEQTDYMQVMLPRSQTIEYESSSHYPMIEESDRFNYDVGLFLSGKVLKEAAE